MEKIKTHKELKVWQNAMDIAMQIFHASKDFPKEETYSLTDQIRRSSRSVAANLAEAWAKRRYKAAFIAKLNDAESEATETQTWIEFAFRCNYIDSQTVQSFDASYEQILSQIITMMNQSDKWIIPSVKA